MEFQLRVDEVCQDRPREFLAGHWSVVPLSRVSTYTGEAQTSSGSSVVIGLVVD